MSSAVKRNALGKGLGALLSDKDQVANADSAIGTTANAQPAVNSIAAIPLNQIEANPFQPRDQFEEEALNELAESIKLQGIIQPLTVRRLSAKSYQLISGERRLRASKIAGLTEVPAYIRTANDQEMIEMALIENIQRENLNAMEVAFSFQRMIDECNLKQDELGERVGKNRTTVTNYLRLLKLPPMIQAAIRDQQISMGHARAMVSMENIDQQLYVFKEILTKDLSVRKVEDLVRSMLTPKKEGKEKVSNTGKFLTNNFEYQKIQDDLSSKFGNKVLIKADDKGKGNINIPFLSTDDLNRILEMLDW
ncbi:MAG: ParB/RepB/Spo0J family partition protein [Sphingobacteriales bacterium]|jgi:ParB family chromosome partitioning protein|nr:ParB/RepB/Spo0J family partition protein [Sphingobacteriales bacterium]